MPSSGKKGTSFLSGPRKTVNPACECNHRPGLCILYGYGTSRATSFISKGGLWNAENTHYKLHQGQKAYKACAFTFQQTGIDQLIGTS